MMKTSLVACGGLKNWDTVGRENKKFTQFKRTRKCAKFQGYQSYFFCCWSRELVKSMKLNNQKRVEHQWLMAYGVEFYWMPERKSVYLKIETFCTI